MQQLQIATTCESMFETASKQLINRELLYNKDSGVLYIKYNDEMRQIGSKADGDNIILNEFGELALADHVHCKTLTVAPDESGLVYKDNVVFAETTDTKRIVLLFKIDRNAPIGTMGGKFYEGTANCTSSYDFSASVSGSRYIRGSSNGEEAVYYRCTYLNEDYLGVMFNPNATIYFSGFELIPSELKVDFDYDDKSFTTLVKLQDEADSGTSTEIIAGKNAITWEFDSYVDGLPDDHTTVPNTEYDLTRGLIINPDFEGTVTFRPDVIVNDDVGYIRISGAGKALRLNVGKDKDSVTLKVYFASNANEERNLILSENESGAWLNSASSKSITDIQTLTQELKTNTHYYLGSSSSGIRIHKMILIYKEKNVIEGWDAFNETWDFTSTPAGWNQGSEINLGNGVYVYRYDDWDLPIYPNETGYTSSRVQNRGYYMTNGTVTAQRTIRFENPNDNSTFSVMFCTGRDGGNRNLSIYDEMGNQLASKNNKYQTYLRGNSDTGLAIVTLNNLPKGNYYVTNSAQLKIWLISVSNPGKDDVISDSLTIDTVTDLIDDLEETGETGDAHYLTLSDMILTTYDLATLADFLRNSDKKVHLDLSTCTVADDAKSITNIFNKCTSLIYISLPQGIETIGMNTFTGCLFLEKVVLPESLTEISSNGSYGVFSGTRVRTIVLPKGFKKLGRGVFANSGLRYLVIRPDTETHFINMLSYGSMHDTLDYVKVCMTPTEKAAHDYTLGWEHTNYFGDTADNTIEAHILEYTDLNALLESVGYGD